MHFNFTRKNDSQLRVATGQKQDGDLIDVWREYVAGTWHHVTSMGLCLSRHTNGTLSIRANTADIGLIEQHVGAALLALRFHATWTTYVDIHSPGGVWC